ncbi:MAG: AAA family ATPase [Bacteroidetes bacterium]|nr:AAA family ATPase [Bacteroidota bacterium]
MTKFNEISNSSNTCETIDSYALDEMFEVIKKEPPTNFIYSGIKENSIGFIFGSSKSGKTIFCENLGMSIAAGACKFLNEPIHKKNGKVLFISLEEFYKPRTERNKKQAIKLKKSYGKDWIKNYRVVDNSFPRYISTDEDWQILNSVIEKFEPNVVFIDSLSRLCPESIEESIVAQRIMKRLRELCNITNTTIIVIHHTPKLYNTTLSINSLAGSRILAQEADFLIGINKAQNGQRYAKEVAFRYHPENDEKVKLFEIDNDCWLHYIGDEDELKIISSIDGRRTDNTRSRIYEFMLSKREQYYNNIPFEIVCQRFVSTKEMTAPALNANLNKLIADEKISRVSKGFYKIASN